MTATIPYSGCITRAAARPEAGRRKLRAGCAARNEVYAAERLLPWRERQPAGADRTLRRVGTGAGTLASGRFVGGAEGDTVAAAAARRPETRSLHNAMVV